MEIYISRRFPEKNKGEKSTDEEKEEEDRRESKRPCRKRLREELKDFLIYRWRSRYGDEKHTLDRLGK